MRFIPTTRRGRLRAGAALAALVAAVALSLTLPQALSSGPSHARAAIPARPAAAAVVPAADQPADPTNGAVAGDVVQALLANGYQLTGDGGPSYEDFSTSITGHADLEKTWEWYNGDAPGRPWVYVVNNQLRRVSLKASGRECTFHIPYHGMPFRSMLLGMAPLCFQQGPGWHNHEVLDLAFDGRAVDGTISVDSWSVRATFSEPGTDLPQADGSEVAQLVQQGYRVTGSKVFDGNMLEYTRAGWPNVFSYQSDGQIDAIGTNAAFCSVPWAQGDVMVAIAQACLAQGPGFTVRMSNGGSAGWIRTRYGWSAVSYYPGAYFQYLDDVTKR